MKFETGILYKQPSRKLKFHENQLNDSHALLRRGDEFLVLLSTFIDRVW
jgi:hypothetical protein